MLGSLAIPIIALCAVAAWTACSAISNSRHTRQRLQALRHGVSCAGTVVGVQRPFLLDPCVRVYFEFVPEGQCQPLRCCHVSRCDVADLAPALPPTGSQVQVSYLPEQPESAVLVSRELF